MHIRTTAISVSDGERRTPPRRRSRTATIDRGMLPTLGTSRTELGMSWRLSCLLRVVCARPIAAARLSSRRCRFRYRSLRSRPGVAVVFQLSRRREIVALRAYSCHSFRPSHTQQCVYIRVSFQHQDMCMQHRFTLDLTHRSTHGRRTDDACSQRRRIRNEGELCAAHARLIQIFPNLETCQIGQNKSQLRLRDIQMVMVICIGDCRHFPL